MDLLEQAGLLISLLDLAERAFLQLELCLRMLVGAAFVEGDDKEKWEALPPVSTRHLHLGSFGPMTADIP